MTRIERPQPQRGASTLVLTLVVLGLVTLLTLAGNRAVLVEMKTATNQYWYTAAFQAAQGALEHAVAWLATPGNAKGAPWTAAWSANATNAPYDQRNNTSVPAQTFGIYATTVTLWRHSSRPSIVEIQSTSTSADGSSATVRQVVNVSAGVEFNVGSVAPLTVNGCISGVTGTPDIGADPTTGASIVASGAAACVDSGHFSLAGSVQTSAFTGTAWSYVFSSAKTDVAMAAQSQSGGPTGGPIYYYDDASVGSYHPSDLGTPTAPILLIFDITSGSCPKINGGRTIYGIVYCGQGFDMQGWGGTTIYGSMVVETSITKFTANTLLTGDGVANDTGNYNTTPAVAKVAGTWRDF